MIIDYFWLLDGSWRSILKKATKVKQ